MSDATGQFGHMPISVDMLSDAVAALQAERDALRDRVAALTAAAEDALDQDSPHVIHQLLRTGLREATTDAT